jgi:hypothetical protein
MEEQLYHDSSRHMLGKVVFYTPTMIRPRKDLPNDMMDVDGPQALISPGGDGEESAAPPFTRVISVGLRVAVDFPNYPPNGGDTIHGGVIDGIWWDKGEKKTFYHVMFDDNDAGDYDHDQIQGKWDLFKETTTVERVLNLIFL